jgi:hypothetical protein
VSPGSHDFGSVVESVGKGHQSFRIENVGTADLHVRAPTLVGTEAADFAIEAGGQALTLSPGQKVSIDVMFAPAGLGAKSASLRILSDDPGKPSLEIALTGRGVALPVPALVIDPASQDWGSILVGTSSSKTFVIRNDGSADLDVTATTLGGPNAAAFSIQAGGAPFTLAPEQTRDLVIGFDPPSTGTMTASLHVVSNDPDVSDLGVPLSGLGVATPVPALTIEPTSYDYGDVFDGAAAGRMFEVRNDGTATLSVTMTSLVGADAAAFSIDTGGGPFALGPGEARDLEITFRPPAAGPVSASFRLESNDPDEPSLDVPLSGNGVAIPLPDISLEPTSHDYGDVLEGSTAGRTFVVRNVGTAMLDVTTTSLVGGDASAFAIGSGGAPFALTPGETRDVEITFRPLAVGSMNASLRVASNDPDEPSLDVPLSGNGVAIPVPDISIDPASYDYGSIPEGSFAARTFVVRNAGTGNLTVTGTSIVGTDAAAFTIDVGGGNFVLAPGETRGVGVAFRPTALGTRSAAFRVESDDPDEPSLDVPITGVGAPIPVPDIALSPVSWDWGDVFEGTGVPQTFTVSNQGTADLSVTAVEIVGSDAGSFTIDGSADPFVLAPGETRDLNVRFAPGGLGAKSATLRIESDDPDESRLDVALSGRGVPVPVPDIAVTPTSHDFGDVIAGTTISHTFTVSNDGRADLAVTATSLVGADFAAFSIDLGGGPFVLTPGETHDLEIGFTPATPGSATAALRLASDDPDQASLDVPLSGHGLAAFLDISFEEAVLGGGSGGSVTTSGNVTAVPGDFYLAAISTRALSDPSDVTGLGLTWTRVTTQCGGRGQTGVDVWRSEGTPTGDGPVTATIPDGSANAVVVVSRYSGVDPTLPIGATVTGNTNGVAGGCTGGTDTIDYSLNLTTSTDRALVYAAIATRNRTHTPGAGYSGRGLLQAGSGGGIAGITTMDRVIPAAGSAVVDGSLGNIADWAVVGIELLPAPRLPLVR